MTKREISVTAELARVRRRIQIEGASVAVEALLAVCKDPKSPAPAKATAGVALLRAAGLADKTTDPGEKELHEMTGEELARAVQRIREEQAERDSLEDDQDEDGAIG
jgi:hypothetical protein